MNKLNIRYIKHYISVKIFSIFNILFIISVILIISCKKDDFATDQSYKINFSNDSILFDTVFTTVGSTTKQLKIYNTNNKKIRISSIHLAGGTNSNFRININGYPSVSAYDIEIDANDSLYIFVKVTVDPTNQNSPLVIMDSIIFETNNNIQKVKLIAWGQDAYYHTPDTPIENLGIYISYAGCATPWKNDKPHLIYGYMVIDTDSTLTIPEGTQIYLHPNAVIWVYDGGTMKVNGTKDNRVYFQGDRLEQSYKDIPGQWNRIWLSAGSKDNEINYAVIKNGTVAIQADTLGNSLNPTLIIHNTIIKNMSSVGILAQGTAIDAFNCVISNCGQYSLILSLGGDYDFRHCTLGNYWDYSLRQTPSLVLNNWYKDIYGQIQLRPLNKAYFGNCIIYGNNEKEILLDENQDEIFSYKFDHCLLKTELSTSDENYYVSCIKNLDPLFIDYAANNYQLNYGSPAIDKGSISVLTSSPYNICCDINGNGRKLCPDLGAYESN